MRYYDLQRHWTDRIIPHLDDTSLNATLVHDCNRFTYGRWKKRFLPGMLPSDFETNKWILTQLKPRPRFWKYVLFGACHWLVNFNLHLAQLAAPDQDWRIITSETVRKNHSSVWNGKEIIFEMNFLALRYSADQCFKHAYGEELAPGEQLWVNYAPHWTEEP